MISVLCVLLMYKIAKVISSLPPAIHSWSDFTNFVSAFDFARLCIGNSEQSFIEVVKN